MPKRIIITLSALVAFGLLFSVISIALANNDQATSATKVSNPLQAHNIRIVKKANLPFAEDLTKGKPPSPPGTEKKPGKNSGRTATGILGDPVTGEKYAIIIGICQYPGDAYDICLSDGDSYNMRKSLIERYGYASENIIWLRDLGGSIEGVDYVVPTRENIYAAIAEIKAKTNPNDEVVFFFSGHGADGDFPDPDNETMDEAIVVHDDDGLMDNDESAELDFIWDEDLKLWFQDLSTNRLAFVFDSCLAGGMNDLAAEGRVVVMATEETKLAYVYSTGLLGEGFFSHYFVNYGLLQGLGDGYNQLEYKDGGVVIEEGFDFTRENFPKWMKRLQKPVIDDKFINDFLL